MSDNRPVRYEEGGRVIYRASGLALCDKIFVALAMGYSPQAYPAWFQEVLDEGTRNESVIREMYEAIIECPIEFVGTTYEKHVYGNVWLRGSIDGRFTADRPVLFDAKKIRDSGWNRYLRVGVEYQANYPMQMSAYMHMMEEAEGVGLDLHLVGGRYVQDEKTGLWSITEVVPHVYIDPPVPWRGIAKRIVGLERTIHEAAQGNKAIGDIRCTNRTFPCPMYYLHDVEDEMEPPERPADNEIAPLLTELAGLSDDLEKGKVATAREKYIKDAVKSWLLKSGQESGDVSTVKIGDDEWQLKYLTSSRAGYPVKPTEVTKVTISQVKKAGEDTGAKPVRKSRGKKAS